MTKVGRLVRAGIALAVLTALAWAGACSDNPGGPNLLEGPEPEGWIVSDPVPAPSMTAAIGTLSTRASSAADEVAYVSLAPGTVPTGSTAIIGRVGDATSLTTAVFDGGFDPVPVRAQTGDSIEVLVRDAGGATIAGLRLMISASRPPIVVRTQPPRRKTDVPLNSAIVVVFSEPVDGASVTAGSIRLLQGATTVAGTVGFVDATFGATELMAEFVSDAPLAPGTEYQLVVTRQVRDLDGDALASSDTVAFTTGQSSTGPPASIQTSPDSTLSLVTGATYQVTATVRDAAGNQLTDQPVTWSSSDPAVLTVSPTGLLTALGDGFAAVTARVGGRADALFVFISPNPPASVAVAPSPATVAQGDTLHLTATVRDAAGREINRPLVTWTSSDQGRASVSVPGFDQWFAIVSGLAQGGVTITATSGAATGGSAVTVGPPPPVASVTITPDAATLLTQASVPFAATLRDANGRLLIGRPIVWQSDDETIATVDGNGVVTGVAPGAVDVTATSEGVVDTATITVTQITLGTLTTGYYHTCGVSSNAAAYCWGWNSHGQLGDGTTDTSFTPVAVSGAIAFSRLSASVADNLDHTCGIATNGSAYCWGYNGDGQLGNGTITGSEVTPVTVTGALTFSTVSSGARHTCGVTTAGAAYCWGENNFGQLGTGSQSFSREPVPVPVTGGLTFSAVSAGGYATCGLTTAGALYCWGLNAPGGSTANPTPVPVMTGLTFSAVTVGTRHACALTAAGAAFCWGENWNGELGNGSTSITPLAPVAVTGGLTFSRITAGAHHTCGVTAAGTAYCWGANTAGQLGFVSNPPEGSNPDHPAPEPVSGGLAFTAVSAGGAHSCGLTTSGEAYCWGANQLGQLGVGTTVRSSNVPIKVAGQP